MVVVDLIRYHFPVLLLCLIAASLTFFI